MERGILVSGWSSGALTPEVILEAHVQCPRELTYLRGQWGLRNLLCPDQPGWQPHFHSLSFEEHSKPDLFFWKICFWYWIAQRAVLSTREKGVSSYALTETLFAVHIWSDKYNNTKWLLLGGGKMGFAFLYRLRFLPWTMYGLLKKICFSFLLGWTECSSTFLGPHGWKDGKGLTSHHQA